MWETVRWHSAACEFPYKLNPLLTDGNITWKSSSRSIYISTFPTGIRIVEPSGSVKISCDSSSFAIRTPWERNRRRSRKTSTSAVRRFQVWRNTRHHVISSPRRCPTQHPCHRSVTSRTAHKFMFINFFAMFVYGFSGILASACRPYFLSPNSCSMEAKLFNVNTKLDERRFSFEMEK